MEHDTRAVNRDDDSLANQNLSELKRKLDEALKDENYEFAALIRDEISRKEA